MFLNGNDVGIGDPHQLFQQVHEVLRTRGKIEEQFDELKVLTESILVDLPVLPNAQGLLDDVGGCLLIHELPVFLENADHYGYQ